MRPADYRFFGARTYLTPASLFATRGCNHRCDFCVSSRYMGPFRAKPLDVLEQEIDQLQDLYPAAYLQFTDDNLLADRKHGAAVLDLLRRKKRRFVTMVTLDQFCDRGRLQEMAAAGCLGVAVGIESVDDDNVLAVHKFQNVGRPFPHAVRRANELGIQVCGLLMLGLPHDTPERLAHAAEHLKRIPCALYDIRILRMYPSTSLYRDLLAQGKVTRDWWLGDGSLPTNHVLPGCLSVHFQHDHFRPMELQSWALKLTSELNRMTVGAAARVLRVGGRGGGARFAATLLSARHRSATQARRLQARVGRISAIPVSP